jgi:hypothetical protein
MKRTAQFIEETKAKSGAGTETKQEKRGKHANSRKNLRPAWKTGQSGNPTGLPGTDLAALSARRFFEAHPEIEDFQVPKGFNAYAFSVLADRGYGKLHEKHDVTVTGILALKLEEARRRAKK